MPWSLPYRLLLLFSLSILCTGTYALSPGELDTGFNTKDQGLGASDGFDRKVKALLELPDGKVLVGGDFSRYMRYTQSSGLARLNGDGSYDASFLCSICANTSLLVRQPDGKILALGGFNHPGAGTSPLARLNSDGTSDVSFNLAIAHTSPSSFSKGFWYWNGKATYPQRGYPYELLLADDGKILLSGAFDTLNGINNLGMIRLNSDGTQDLSFNPARADIGYYRKLHAIQTDGKIILSIDGYLKRLNSDGTADTAFNNNAAGKLIGADYGVLDVQLRPDGKIYAAGDASKDLVRFNSDGTLDSSFIVSSGLHSVVNRFFVQADGKILLGGLTVSRIGSINTLTGESLGRLNADGSLDSSFTSTIKNGTINALIQTSSGRILVGGDMQQNAERFFVGLNTNGFPDSSYLPNQGTSFTDSIQTHTVQPDGKILVGGKFGIRNGSATLHGFARLNADGTPDARFNARLCQGFNLLFENPVIKSIALQQDGKILVGGIFSKFNGANYSNLMRFHSDGSIDTSFSSKLSSFTDSDGVGAIAVQADGKILVGSGGSAILARLYPNGSSDNSFAPGGLSTFSSYADVRRILPLSDGKILVGSEHGGILARLYPDGSVDTAFSNLVSSRLSCLPTCPGYNYKGAVTNIHQQADGKLILAGIFNQYNGTAVHGLMRLYADGNLDTAFTSNLGNSLAIGDSNYQINGTALLADGRLLLAGSFTNGLSLNYLAMVKADGTLDAAFNQQLGKGADDHTFTVSQLANGKFLASGNFLSINGTGRTRITRINSDGSLDLGSAPDGTVYAASMQPDKKLVIGGAFTRIGATARPHIARLMENGALDSSFAPGTGTDDTVYSTSLQPDNKIFIAGQFTTFNGAGRNRIARLANNGSLDTTFNPGTGADNTIFTTALQTDGKLLIGGNFLNYNGTSITRLARLNSNGTLDSSFNPGSGANDTIYTAALHPGGKLMIGGAFTSYNGVAVNHVARIRSDGSLDTSFHPSGGADGIIRSILVQSDGNIVLGGDFITFNGASHDHLVRVQTDGSVDTSFSSNTDDSVENIETQADGKLVIGGQFNSVNGNARGKIARLETDGSVDSDFDPGHGADGDIHDSVILPDENIVIAGDFTAYDDSESGNIARLKGGSSTQKNDGDSDGIKDSEDNCPTIANTSQLDTDQDLNGDACDFYPLDTCECVNTDGDSYGNNLDDDDDDDGISDSDEIVMDSNPLDASSGPEKMTIISFETGIPSGWTTPASSNASWFTTSTEASHLSNSLRSGSITHNRKTQIEFSAQMLEPSFSLGLKKSTETSDCFRIYVDGLGKLTQCGANNWETFTIPITTGTHTIRFEYSKNGSLSSGSDAIWIDRVAYFDGTDTDGDGMTNTFDPDDDNDGLPDSMDSAPLTVAFPFNATYRGSGIQERAE